MNTFDDYLALRLKHTGKVVLMRNGDGYRAYCSHADMIAYYMNWPHAEMDGNGRPVLNVPTDKVEEVVSTLAIHHFEVVIAESAG